MFQFLIGTIKTRRHCMMPTFNILTSCNIKSQAWEGKKLQYQNRSGFNTQIYLLSTSRVFYAIGHRQFNKKHIKH